MKQLFTFLTVAAVALTLQAKTYTFADLANIENTGVTVVDGAYVVSPNTDLTEAIDLDEGGINVSKTQLTITEGNSLKLNGGEVIKFSGNVQLVVKGLADFAPEQRVTITADEASTATAKGFWINGDQADAKVENIDFYYVGLTFSNGTGTGKLVMRNCTMTDFNGKNSQQAISFNASNDGNIIEDCTFTTSMVSAIGTGSNTPVGLTVRNCVFDRNSTQKRNRPQINVTAGPYDILIEGNTVTGIGENTLAGGIAVSNLLGVNIGDAVYTVRNNTIKDNRYGITLTGKGVMVVEGNTLLYNHWDANPETGGSGINITDSKGVAKATITGNHIEGSYWGISIIGTATTDVNIGKVEDPTAADYNPGHNVFVNNGVNDQFYDLYNNSPATIYAQGNKWNVSEIDKIEDVIFHKNNDPTLGEVIYLPVWSDPTSVTDLKVNPASTDNRYYNLMGQPVSNSTPGIYIHQGKKVIVK